MKTAEQNYAVIVTEFIEDLANVRIMDTTDQFFAGQIGTAFMNRRYVVEELLVQGERVTAWISMTAQHAGAFLGNKATERAIKAVQFREFQLKAGVIETHRGWFDTSSLLPQLQPNG
ncbi:ester cyclase [Paenibacillus pasadenensis]|uniref:ester cyclase n=1 Tax=Paenibacillus pasadenensis TaxID=217090 RepID=UPI00203EF748|nr:ester cyclase [Paenibacillus pasadenensis]MCM3746771.1 ester cyclase [Paenibacillus pasadenensis]